VALLFKKLMGVFTGSAMQRQGHCRMINARAITFGARTGLSSFLRHRSPTALYFMSLRQTGTPLATGMPFGTESPLFQRTRWRRRPGFGRGFHGKDVHRECPLWGQKRSSAPGHSNVRFAPIAVIGALGAEQQNGWGLAEGSAWLSEAQRHPVAFANSVVFGVLEIWIGWLAGWRVATNRRQGPDAKWMILSVL